MASDEEESPPGQGTKKAKASGGRGKEKAGSVRLQLKRGELSYSH